MGFQTVDNSHPSFYKPKICHGRALAARRPAAPLAEGGGGRGGRAAQGDARTGGRREFRWNCSRCVTAVLGDSGDLPGHGGCAATEATAAPPAAAEAALRGWEVAVLASDRALAASPLRALLASQERGRGGTETASSETVEAEGDQLRGAQRAKRGQTQGIVPTFPAAPVSASKASASFRYIEKPRPG